MSGYARHQCVKRPPPREGYNYYLQYACSSTLTFVYGNVSNTQYLSFFTVKYLLHLSLHWPKVVGLYSRFIVHNCSLHDCSLRSYYAVVHWQSGGLSCGVCAMVGNICMVYKIQGVMQKYCGVVPTCVVASLELDPCLHLFTY